MKGIQIIGILVGLYLVAQMLLNYWRGEYGIRRTIFLVILWSLIIILFTNPSLASLALPILTTQDLIMSVLVMGVLVVFILMTILSLQIARIENKLTVLAQNLAINDYVNKIGIKILRNHDNEK